MLLSDRDINASLDSGRIRLDPLDRDLVQPASIDVRLDRLFCLFDNHRYPVIDPAADQAGLTHLVDVGADEPFVLHPGEFVLGATYERITLPDDVAADPLARDAATAATTALAAAAGAWAVRVHEVPANRAAVRTASLWKEHQ